MPDKVVIFVVLSVIGVLFFGTLNRLSTPIPVTPISIEKLVKAEPPRPVPQLAVKGPAVVTFWATWCMPCIRELPTFLAFKTRAEQAGLTVVAINVDKEGAAAAEPFLAKHNLAGLATIYDPENKLARSLGIKGLPTTLILNEKGEEAARMDGETDWSQPEAVEMVKSLLKGA